MKTLVILPVPEHLVLLFSPLIPLERPETLTLRTAYPKSVVTTQPLSLYLSLSSCRFSMDRVLTLQENIQMWLEKLTVALTYLVSHHLKHCPGDIYLRRITHFGENSTFFRNIFVATRFSQLLVRVVLPPFRRFAIGPTHGHKQWYLYWNITFNKFSWVATVFSPCFPGCSMVFIGQLFTSDVYFG